METHYYLINGTVKKGSKMPDEKDIDTLRDYKQHYNNWLSSLQPCDIDESELKKIKEHLMFYIGEPPIDITDIVSAQVICTATRCDGECIECNHMSIGITFKQPKQVESECEAVESQIDLIKEWISMYNNRRIDADFIDKVNKKFTIKRNI